jgi:hypothetical protein
MLYVHIYIEKYSLDPKLQIVNISILTPHMSITKSSKAVINQHINFGNEVETYLKNSSNSKTTPWLANPKGFHYIRFMLQIVLLTKPL